ncbi:M23 family metallopeptidase [Rhodococcus sp. X156]|uniref:M23 family metallopeptidase n=1 Tax=Rhodococcus sp. X156 TaxID=2499145 RepID=UPI001F49F1B1|nr:M23 family metallopeptidase [Rhodococcus sp. X156]
MPTQAPDVPAPRGTYSWPLGGWPLVARPFQPPASVYGPGHRGVDLLAAAGAPVLAAGAGTVVFAGPLAGRGVVSVQHPSGLRTTYEPVTAQVAAGAPVQQGQVLGVLQAGHAGCPGAACLHWGVRRGETYLDPLRLVGSWPVRLKPWAE